MNKDLLRLNRPSIELKHVKDYSRLLEKRSSAIRTGPNSRPVVFSVRVSPILIKHT